LQALLAQQQQQQQPPSDNPSSSTAPPLLEDIEALLTIAACLREFGSEPRPDWTVALVQVSGAALKSLAIAAAEEGRYEVKYGMK
jgi:hypothetical protein